LKGSLLFGKTDRPHTMGTVQPHTMGTALDIEINRRSNPN